MLNKKQIVKTLETIALYMEIKGENSFKVSAYRRAAQSLETDPRPAEKIGNPEEIKGIGKGTASVIQELLEHGKSSLLEELQAALPNGLIQLLHVPNLGGKKIAKLYNELGIENIEQLKEACGQGRVRNLQGFGVKTEEKILQSIQELGKRPDRLPVAAILPLAEKIEQYLSDFTSIDSFSKAGSLRRMKETVKDLDFIISTKNPSDVKEYLLKMEGITEVIASGDTKISLVFGDTYPTSVDFRIVKTEEFATALHHFTGSMEHNVKMRQIAKQRNEKISEYGVENTETGEMMTFSSETDFYQHFGLAYIPPEVREGKEEINQFKTNHHLIKTRHIKGDLHMHSTWSDGAHSIEEMAEAARLKGYSYIAITDHSQYLKVANGLTPERIKLQKKEIDRLNSKYTDFKILSGIEMDILPDGTLDFEDDVLAELDFVIASIHSAFSQSQDQIMKRLKAAFYNQYVDLIAHPTGRLIGRREGYEPDMEMLIKLAAETGTALELNANPNRLDLSAEWLQKAQEEGIKISINTDAHYKETLKHMEIGTSYARKGWLKPESVINTMSLQDLTAYLSQKR